VLEETEVVLVAAVEEENIILHMSCKLPLLGTFLMFYMEMKDCIVETFPSFKIPPPHPMNYLL
jgi:hypothetical protein